VLIEYRFGSMKAAREDLYHAFHYRAAPFTRAEVSEARVARGSNDCRKSTPSLFLSPIRPSWRFVSTLPPE